MVIDWSGKTKSKVPISSPLPLISYSAQQWGNLTTSAIPKHQRVYPTVCSPVLKLVFGWRHEQRG